MQKDELQQMISESELKLNFIRSDGPGGQNVNKVATAVQLRFDISGSRSLSQEVKDRLIKSAGKRMTKGGILLIEAKHYRTQDANRANALTRFYTLLHNALEKPKKRRITQPSRSSREERLKDKKRRGVTKRGRVQNYGEQE